MNNPLRFRTIRQVLAAGFSLLVILMLTAGIVGWVSRKSVV